MQIYEYIFQAFKNRGGGVPPRDRRLWMNSLTLINVPWWQLGLGRFRVSNPGFRGGGRVGIRAIWGNEGKFITSGQTRKKKGFLGRHCSWMLVTLFGGGGGGGGGGGDQSSMYDPPPPSFLPYAYDHTFSIFKRLVLILMALKSHPQKGPSY